MRREWSNTVRFVMDELVPPAIRDSRWFMKPWFMAAYGTTDVQRFMDFKQDVWAMTPEEYAAFYRSLGSSVSRRRETDLNQASIDWIVDSIPAGPVHVLDVGCGNGHLLAEIALRRPEALLTGVDVFDSLELGRATYVQALLPVLPFPDRSFDVVCCTHVLEHVTELAASCREISRVGRGQALLVVPRQRSFQYTLDEHVNFFWDAGALGRFFLPHRVRAALLGGDWALRVLLDAVIRPLAREPALQGTLPRR